MIFSLAQVPTIASVLAHGAFAFQWPGLDLSQVDEAGKVRKINTILTVNYLSVAGTLLFISGILTMIAFRVSAAAAVRLFGATLVQVRWALATIFMILAIAFVMNWSGQTTTLGRFLAGAGPAYALLSPVIGWIGVVVTGSDNSTNALFGHLQVVAAKETGISPVLLAASNTTGYSNYDPSGYPKTATDALAYRHALRLDSLITARGQRACPLLRRLVVSLTTEQDP